MQRAAQPFGVEPGEVLETYYEELFRQFGPQGWWPARTRLEVILGAILTQNTAWTNVEKAMGNLKREGLLDPDRLREAGMVPRSAEMVKILAEGEIAHALTIRAHAFSKAVGLSGGRRSKVARLLLLHPPGDLGGAALADGAELGCRRARGAAQLRARHRRALERVER